jgi:nucleoid-associated protein YgaU
MIRTNHTLDTRARHHADGSRQYHIVKRGETLSKIAETYYGDAKCASSLIEANRDVLPPSEDIRPGQKLRIPKTIRYRSG